MTPEGLTMKLGLNKNLMVESNRETDIFECMASQKQKQNKQWDYFLSKTMRE